MSDFQARIRREEGGGGGGLEFTQSIGKNCLVPFNRILSFLDCI